MTQAADCGDNTAPTPRPAATVVLLRNGKKGLETLLLKRNKNLLFAGGFWVFPGGAIDDGEVDACAGDMDAAAKTAAAREAEEEAGVCPDLDSLVQISHWTTPEAEPKRFYTWFFAAPCPDNVKVKIDGCEIHDAQWISITQALQRHEAGELGLFPPTYITLLRLKAFSSVNEALTALAGEQPPSVQPVFTFLDDQVVVMLEGDAGYDSADAALEGPRHRVRLKDSRWHYEYENACVPPMDGRNIHE